MRLDELTTLPECMSACPTWGTCLGCHKRMYGELGLTFRDSRSPGAPSSTGGALCFDCARQVAETMVLVNQQRDDNKQG